MHLKHLPPSLDRFLLSQGSRGTFWVHPGFFQWAAHLLYDVLFNRVIDFLKLLASKIFDIQVRLHHMCRINRCGCLIEGLQ
jgi:hypothetical protein